MFTSVTIAAGLSAVIFSRFLSSHPAFLDTPRLPSGARFTEPEAKVIAAILRFGGLAAVVGVILATAASVVFS